MPNARLAFLALASLCLLAAFPGKGDRSALPRAPKENWRKLFPLEVKGFAVAAVTGEVAAHTESEVFFFRGTGQPEWTAGAGQEWKHVEGLAINRDGSRVIFQTDLKPRKDTEAMTLTLHLLDGQGRELWQKPNPGRYQSMIMSPGGSFILLGELFHPGLKCYDRDLNLQWEKPLQFWHLRFDPTEQYLLDGEGGRLYTTAGTQVWDFGPWTRVLSVSDGSGYVMTQYYRTTKAAQSIFLFGRNELKKIELKGASGCVSPDGARAAYVSTTGNLLVFETPALLAGGQAAEPLFSVPLQKAWMMQISRDNRTLLALGVESDHRSVLTLLDLENGRTAWKQEVDPSLRSALAPEDNREVTIQPDPRTLVNYRVR